MTVDRKPATYVATSVLALGLFVSAPARSALGAGTLSKILDASIPPVPVSLVVDGTRRALRSSQPTVAALLAAQGVTLHARDVVNPRPSAPLHAGAIVRVVRVVRLTRTMLRSIPAPLHAHPDPSLIFGRSRTLRKGAPGLREIVLAVERRDDGSPEREYRSTRVLRAPRARVVAYGTKLPGFGFVRNALAMDATAYAPNCDGCSGITATGRRAGHGLVAVDPSVIPLGTRLYVPGYGPALAADIGGAIRGHRIDLGFDDLGDAMRFGRRDVTVYVLR